MAFETPKLLHLFADFSAHSIDATVAQAQLAALPMPMPPVISTPELRRGHVVQAAVFMQMVIEEFPENSVHLCHLGLNPSFNPKIILCQFKNRLLIAPDIGLLPAITQEEQTDYYEWPVNQNFNDPLKDIYIPILSQIWNGSFDFDNLKPCLNPKKSTMLSPVYQNNSLRITVLFNDPQGNAITNLKREDFERFGKGRAYRIRYSPMGDSIDRICKGPFELDPGTAGAFFGPGGFLILTFKESSARQYMGMVENKNILVEFAEN